MLSARNLRVSERRNFARPRKCDQFSEARSSALGGPIDKWPTRVGSSVPGLKTFFGKLPCQTSVGVTKTRKPGDDFAGRVADCC